MGIQHRVGFKLILIYLISVILALTAVLLVAESIISQQVYKRHQKKLDTLSQKVFFSLEKEKDQIRLMARAIANFGQVGILVEKGDIDGIRRLVVSVFKESDLDVLFLVGNQNRELVRLQSDRFRMLNPQEGEQIKKAIRGNYRVRMSRWAQGIFVSGSAPIMNEESFKGQVFAGVLIDNHFLEELAKDTDSFLAIIKEGNVIASTFSNKKEPGEELEFSEELLQDIKALKGQPLPVKVEEKLYTMKSLPLRDWEGHALGFLVIGLSRGELTQTLSSLRRIILGVGGAGVLLGILLTVLLTHRMRRQISYLSAGTEKIIAGDLSEAIPRISRDELGSLAGSFNTMAQTLKERNRILEEEKDKILANVDFLSMMVHDVKAPISGIRLLIETLLEEPLPAAVKERLGAIGESLEELLMHLYNVLTISQIEKGPFTLRKERSDLNSSVSYVRSQCQVLADRKEIRLVEELGPDLPAIEADEFYLERLMYNLIINAVHWAPAKGWVRIRTGTLRTPDKNEVFLEVSDSGPGIPPDQKPSLFGKYSAQKEKGDLMGVHSGLGLFISQTIARAHGGSLREEGRPGEGARFVCILPATDATG
jgi:signal transduction histidine kinase